MSHNQEPLPSGATGAATWEERECLTHTAISDTRVGAKIGTPREL